MTACNRILWHTTIREQRTVLFVLWLNWKLKTHIDEYTSKHGFDFRLFPFIIVLYLLFWLYTVYSIYAGKVLKHSPTYNNLYVTIYPRVMYIYIEINRTAFPIHPIFSNANKVHYLLPDFREYQVYVSMMWYIGKIFFFLKNEIFTWTYL